MTDLNGGRYAYADRHRVLDAIADALQPIPTHPDGTVTVIVRVTPPSEDVTPETARGCATKAVA